MFGIDLTSKIKSFAPYGVILYLLLGGSNSQEFQEVDHISAQHVVEQINSKTPNNGIRDAYMPYLPSKTHVTLPTTGNLSATSIGAFVRKAMEYPKRLLNGENSQYGY